MQQKLFILGMFIVVIVLLSACAYLTADPIEDASSEQSATKEDSAEQGSTSDLVMEDKRIYKEDEEGSLEHFYVTILDEQSAGDPSFYEMNEFYQFHDQDEDSPVLHVIFQLGDENGPSKKMKGNVPNGNATIQIRGNSSKLEVQKSYKIKLKDSAGLWRGQNNLNLNKHADDITRVKNKLAFDLFKTIPDFISMRTQFVEIHVKDLTAGASSFESYGLYTHVEQANERYLNAHGLNPYGNLYKASRFEFFRYEDTIKVKDDPTYNEEAFERILEIKGSDDHSGLIEMLQAVNDTKRNMDDVVEQYFDKDNYLTWIATNILFGNIDTMSTNYYLYSPPNTDKWYFIPWDYDKGFGWYEERGRYVPAWQTGLARYWGTVLHKRYFKNPENVAALNEKIEELAAYINEKEVERLLDNYYPIVKELVSQPPDLTYFPIELEDFDAEFYDLVNELEKNKAIYEEQLEHPMPIFLGSAVEKNGGYTFNWEYAYDIQGDDLSYTFQISEDTSFETVIHEQADLLGTSTTVRDLPEGRLYWRVLVSDEHGNQQIPFDRFIDREGSYHWGLKEFINQ
ncbi:CotH kinase family protein [Aquibacillus albus]|uniref:Spore coat protein H n=1 Tax=Aquibacillus albus TaxID=1168171 RepID=A0ABS2MVX6_9BACI|nr:CotH kinase family protein [Aquibacillus albus]MBM7570001.1 spore coat protein H [Aquibacillus albus]